MSSRSMMAVLAGMLFFSAPKYTAAGNGLASANAASVPFPSRAPLLRFASHGRLLRHRKHLPLTALRKNLAIVVLAFGVLEWQEADHRRLAAMFEGRADRLFVLTV